MNVKDLFPRRWLTAADLGTREAAVKIRELIQEKVGTERKPVLYFEGKHKGLVLNATNANKIAELHGDETDDWRGKKIVLYVATVKVAGEVKNCIRVRGR